MNYHDPIQPTQRELEIIKSKYFILDAEEGYLYSEVTKWKITSKGSNGYLKIEPTIDGKRKAFRVHHIIWYLHYGQWPKSMLDHRDNVRTNNKISNLRESNNSINTINKYKHSGLLPGVSIIGSKFQSSISINGRLKYLGLYPTEDKAYEVYKDKYKEIYGKELEL